MPYTPPGGVRGKQLDPGTVLKAASAVGLLGRRLQSWLPGGLIIGDALAAGGEVVP